jgi:hypothetical protein
LSSAAITAQVGRDLGERRPGLAEGFALGEANQHQRRDRRRQRAEGHQPDRRPEQGDEGEAGQNAA